MAITVEQLEQLRHFRRAAAQVREASIISDGLTPTVRVSASTSGASSHGIDSLPKEPLRSLAMALRLVYMNDEPAHLFSVCNILYQTGDPTAQDRSTSIRRQYKEALEGADYRLAVGGRAYSHEDILKAWLYGGSFHQNPECEREWEVLQGIGFFAEFAVQAIVLRIAGCVLDLDDAVADVLGERRLPRL